MPVGRHGQRQAWVGTPIFVMGGAHTPGADDSAIVMVYDTSARTWETLAKRMPVARRMRTLSSGTAFSLLAGARRVHSLEKEGMHFEDEPDDDLLELAAAPHRSPRHGAGRQADVGARYLDAHVVTTPRAPLHDGCALYMRDGDWIRSLDQPDLAPITSQPTRGTLWPSRPSPNHGSSGASDGPRPVLTELWKRATQSCVASLVDGRTGRLSRRYPPPPLFRRGSAAADKTVALTREARDPVPSRRRAAHPDRARRAGGARGA